MSTTLHPASISQQRAVPASIRKRDGRVIGFDSTKIVEAVRKAFVACGIDAPELLASEVALEVLSRLSEMGEDTPDVEAIQDLVEKALMDQGHDDVAKAYILYRQRRTVARDQQSALMRTRREITFASAEEADAKRENANVDGNSAMGSMLRYGTESAKQFNLLEVLDPTHAAAHRDGDIHIHDLDFLTLTTTCCQINLTDLFEHGFSTGHGVLRTPQSIGSYAALACIAIQSNQNDQHGGQAVPNFDRDMAPGVAKTFVKAAQIGLTRTFEVLGGDEEHLDEVREAAAGWVLEPDAAALAREKEQVAELFAGLIDNECPKCGRHEDSGSFDRIRRITGYLVGGLDRFNDAKRAEVRDRVKHG